MLFSKTVPITDWYDYLINIRIDTACDIFISAHALSAKIYTAAEFS